MIEFKRKTENLNRTIESIEKIESKNNLDSPLKSPMKKMDMMAIPEEEEKYEMTKEVSKVKPLINKEATRFESSDSLALQLFALKNEEKFEIKPQQKEK